LTFLAFWLPAWLVLNGNVDHGNELFRLGDCRRSLSRRGLTPIWRPVRAALFVSSA